MGELAKYTNLHAWLRQLARASAHAGIGAIIAGSGTNALEKVAPVAFAHVGMDLRQMAAVFAAAAFWEALRRIYAATADTTAPFTPNPPPT